MESSDDTFVNEALESCALNALGGYTRRCLFFISRLVEQRRMRQRHVRGAFTACIGKMLEAFAPSTGFAGSWSSHLPRLSGMIDLKIQ